MKKYASIAIVLTTICLVGATPDQNKTAAVLRTLSFHESKVKDGAPPQFTVSEETIKYLKVLKSAETPIEIDSDGTIKVKARSISVDVSPAPAK